MFEFTWDVDPVLLEVGFLQIRYYGLFFLVVFLGGYGLFRWQVLRAGGTEVDASDIFMPGILGVLIGARLGHVLFYEWQRFLSDPLWLFQIWRGGLASHGATIGLLVAVYFYAKQHRQSYVECMDRFALSAGLGATMVRLGNFFNSEIMGKVTDQTWGVRFPRFDVEVVRAGELAPLRHPTQLYEFALGLFVMFTLWLADRLLGGEKRPRGALIALFFAVYFTGRFLVEFFKEHQALDPSSPLTMGQFLSLPLAVAGVLAFIYSLKRGIPAGWNTAPAAPPKRAKPTKRGKKAGAKRN